MENKSVFMESLIIQKRHLLKLSIYSIPLSFLFVFGVDAIFNEREGGWIPIVMVLGCLIAPALVSLLYKTLIEEELGYYVSKDSSSMSKRSIKLSFLYLGAGLACAIIYNLFGESYIADLLFYNSSSEEKERAIKGIYQSINITVCAILLILISNIMGFVHSMMVLTDKSFSSIRGRLQEMYQHNKDVHKHQKANHNSFIYPIMFSIMFPFILVLIKIVKAEFFGGEFNEVPDFSYFNLTTKDKMFLVIIYTFSVIPNVIVNNFIFIREHVKEKDF